jgi:outer membrane protein OmpA-like peptidoglycan-associated protein
MARRLLWILTIIPLILALDGCGPTPQRARDRMLKKQFHSAAEDYAALSQKKDLSKKDKQAYTDSAAACYKNASQYKNALKWYKKLWNMKTATPDQAMMYCKMLKATEQWTEAIVQLQEFKKRYPGQMTEMADCEISGSENALKWKDMKTRYIVQNEKKLNTKGNDFAPVYGKDGIYFTSDRPNSKGKSGYDWSGHEGYYDLYLSKVDKKKFKGAGNPYASENLGKPLAVADVYTPYNEGTISFDTKGNVMYLTQCGGKDGKDINCKIYMLERKAAGWTEVNYEKPLDFCNDSIHVWGQPSLSADGSKLYFVSDMKGTLGGQDIWVCNYVKKGRTWSNPINLGPTINTEKDEMYPYIHPDGTMYFASKGHCGIGGFDIFMTKGDGVSWSEPQNMRQPVNSAADDFAFICDNTKENGFFTSNRATLKDDDIYSFTMTPLVWTLTIRTFDKNTREMLPLCDVPLTNSYDTIVTHLSTGTSGVVKQIIKGNTDYFFFGKKKYYFDSRNESVTTKGLDASKDFVVDLFLEKQDIPRVLDILYDLDKANIRPDAAVKLDSVVTVLMNFPEIALELGSHTDCRARMDYNCDLSQRRADSAVDYLVRHGIDRDRLIARGYGEFQLINTCACEPGNFAPGCNDDMHQANRRTTTRIITMEWKKGLKLDFECKADSCLPCAKLLEDFRKGQNKMQDAPLDSLNRREPAPAPSPSPSPTPNPQPTPGANPGTTPRNNANALPADTTNRRRPK